MAPESTAITAAATTESPYKFDKAQTIKASSALLKHINTKAQQNDANSTTKNLLAADATSSDAESISLILTSKKFMTDQRRLKPRKIPLPHPLNTSPNTSICLLTPEPQRMFKDAIAHPSFPTSLSQRITKIISVQKLEKKFHSFESKRQLRDSHDIFLADDRIITYLAKALGKTFYETTPKRPIPVHLEAPKPKERKNAALPSTKPKKDTSSQKSVVAPQAFAKEIERTLSTAQLHLSPSTTTAVKVGLATFTPEQLSANIEAVIAGMTDRLIAWRNVKAVHIKGPNTMALPVWLAQELWTDDGMILEDEEVKALKLKESQKGKKKRKAIVAPDDEVAQEGKKRKEIDSIGEEGDSKRKKAKKQTDADLSQEMKERREKLRQQKQEAREKLEQPEKSRGQKRKEQWDEWAAAV